MSDIVRNRREFEEAIDDWKGAARAGEVTIGELQARVAELEAALKDDQSIWLFNVGAGKVAGGMDMRERVAKYMEMRADLIGGEGTTVTGRTIARIYREEAGNIRALPLTNPEGS